MGRTREPTGHLGKKLTPRKRVNGADENRTRNLLIWSQTRYHCATTPTIVLSGSTFWKKKAAGLRPRELLTGARVRGGTATEHLPLPACVCLTGEQRCKEPSTALPSADAAAALTTRAGLPAQAGLLPFGSISCSGRCSGLRAGSGGSGWRRWRVPPPESHGAVQRPPDGLTG